MGTVAARQAAVQANNQGGQLWLFRRCSKCDSCSSVGEGLSREVVVGLQV